jgi:uncharacterized protein YggE
MGITVSGIGTAAAQPDVADVDLGVSVLADTVEEATSVAAERARAVTAALVAAGVLADDLATTEHSIRPEYDYSGNEQSLSGYRVSNMMRARLRDIATTGTVLESVSEAGRDETRVNGLTFGVGDETALRTEARQAAWKDAFAKATQLAGLSGQTLGNATSITETVRPPASPVRTLAADAAERSTPIQPGSTMVTVMLEVEFALAD